MYKKVILVLLIFFNFCSLNTWAWNDKRTHYDLSIKASEHSVLSSTGGDYLKNLGFSNNIKEPFSLNGETKKPKNIAIDEIKKILFQLIFLFFTICQTQ